MLDTQYLAHMVLELCSKGFLNFDLVFLDHALVFLRKTRIFAPMTSLIELESLNLALVSYSKLFFEYLIFMKNPRWPPFFL